MAHKKRGYHVNLKGPAFRTLVTITKATGLQPREAVLAAIYRYEADLIDTGHITPKPEPINDIEETK